MRFESGSILLALVALGVIPHVSARVLYDNPSQVAEGKLLYISSPLTGERLR